MGLDAGNQRYLEKGQGGAVRKYLDRALFWYGKLCRKCEPPIPPCAGAGRLALYLLAARAGAPAGSVPWEPDTAGSGGDPDSPAEEDRRNLREPSSQFIERCTNYSTGTHQCPRPFPGRRAQREWIRSASCRPGGLPPNHMIAGTHGVLSFGRRVRSWLRMNAGGAPNTCKSSGTLLRQEASGERLSNT